ncbi:MAG TPA: thermonuclease family protein [Rhizomicrobium sp.]
MPVASWILLLVVFAVAGRFLIEADPVRFPGFPAAASNAINTGFTLCAERYQANCVVDGDTIHVNGTRIRVEDIDAPETHNPRCASELVLGEQAAQRLLALMNAGPFKIVYTGGRDTDEYGRELRRIERNGRSLGGILVSEGLARLWDGARHPWCN